MPKPTSAPLLRTHPLTGLPITPLGMSKRGLIWPILGGDDTVPPSGTPTPPAGTPGTPPPSPSGDPAGGTPPAAPPKLDLTQAQLDEIISKRIASEKTKFDKEMEALKATAGKSDLEAEKIKREAAEKSVTEVTQASAKRIAGTEAKLAAHLAGARPDRLEAILKQADLTAAVADTGDVDEAAVKTAIEKVLTEYPEWKAAPGTHTPPASGGGEMGNQQPTGAESFTRDQLKKMTPEEYTAKRDIIMKAMAEGRVTG